MVSVNIFAAVSFLVSWAKEAPEMKRKKNKKPVMINTFVLFMLINFIVNKTKDKEGSCEISVEAEKMGDEIGI
jgi:hypothetical protein